jgi:hypothetical protein
VRSILPVDALEFTELLPGFTDESGCFQRMAWSLTPHLPVGHAAKLFVNQWHQLVEGPFISSRHSMSSWLMDFGEGVI